MAAKVTNAGERTLLDVALTNWGAMTVRLARAAFTVADDMVIGEVTEATYPGYAPQTIVYTGLSAGSPGGRAIATFTPIVFLCSGTTPPNLIYGWWLQDGASRILIAERFTGSPRPMAGVSDSITIEPTLRLWAPS